MPRPRFIKRTYSARPARHFARGAWDAWTGIIPVSPRSDDYWAGREFAMERIAKSDFTMPQFDAAVAGAIRGGGLDSE